MLNVQIVLFDGFDLLDAIAPYEVFCAAAMKAGHALQVELVSAEGARPVKSGINGVVIEAASTLNPQQADIIVIPGASGDVEGDHPDTIPQILNRAMQTGLTPFMQQALARENCLVVTVCGGSLLLAMGGLLEGRHAVTHHLGMDVLGATGAVPVPARIVDDGNLVSGGGVTSGLDVALYIVERELGPRIAHAVEQLFEFERRGTVWRSQGIAPLISKSQYETDDELPAQTIVTNNTIEEKEEHVIIQTQQSHKAHNKGRYSGLSTATTTKSAAIASFPAAAAFVGDWETSIATPVGKLQVKLAIFSEDGILKGRATQGDETVDFIHPVLQDNKLIWRLPVTKPMRLNLKFEVAVEGNQMSGTAKAGVLPASKLTGIRIV